MHYAIALVYGWLMDHPEYYCQWVNPYVQIRWSPSNKAPVARRIGGHWRRGALFAKLPSALRCTCKFELLIPPRYLGPPQIPYRERWTEEGEIIPRRYRALVWA